MLTTLLLFIVILGLLVFVHELGHFISAKKLGAKVDEFGFGFPPRAVGVYRDGKKWKWVGRKTPDIKQTIYSINWIPLGGFVKIKGEEGGNKDPDSFASKAIWKRAIILGAGVTMNIVLAMVILGIGFGIGIPQAITDDLPASAKIKERNVQVVVVSKDSPAAKAKIQPGDELISINGNKISFNDIQSYLETNVGKEVKISLNREGYPIEVTTTPEIIEETGKGGIGVGLVEVGIVKYPWYVAFWKGVTETFFFLKEIVIAFGLLFKNLFTGKGLSMDISGPVGIAVITGKVARLGLVYVIQFAAILSINLAIINILPFPALDGGRLLFLAIEKVRGKPVNEKIENIIHNIGFMLLLLLIVVVTFRDFSKFSYKFVNWWQSIVR